MTDDEEDEPMHAKPQLVRSGGEWKEVWPEHWGITLAQCRELLEECKTDPEWNSGNNVYTLVDKYVKPKTAGTGVGYALLQNLSSPREVSVMISHAWHENAEEFVQVLERSVCEDEVMFICAFSLYQCGDGEGPSIAEQLGCTASESPFRRVLQHIKDKGLQIPCWKWRPQLQMFAIFCLWAAQLNYYVMIGHRNCIPTFHRCAIGEGEYSLQHMSEDMGCIFPKWTFHYRDLEAGEKAVLPITIALLACALLASLLSRCMCSYNGRLLAVPNRECDLYGRLWCVYEIFVAMMLGIRTDLAKTLASAGKCSAKTATCGCPEDMTRIFGEIETWGQGVRNRMGTLRRMPFTVMELAKSMRSESLPSPALSASTLGAPAGTSDGALTNRASTRASTVETGDSKMALKMGWRKIDQAIHATTRRAQRSAVFTVLAWVVPYLTVRLNMTLAQGSFTPTPLFSSEICAGIYSQVLAIVVVTLPVLWVVLKAHGRPNTVKMLILAVVLTLLGEGFRWLDQRITRMQHLTHNQQMAHWPPLHHCFGIELGWAGKCLGVVVLASRFCPAFCFHWRWRLHFLLLIALTLLIASVVHALQHPAPDQLYPVIVWYASFRILPVVGPLIFFWGAAATWGVESGGKVAKKGSGGASRGILPCAMTRVPSSGSVSSSGSWCSTSSPGEASTASQASTPEGVSGEMPYQPLEPDLRAQR